MSGIGEGYPPTPELDKLRAVSADNHTEDIGAFLDDSQYVLSEWVTHWEDEKGRQREYETPLLVPVSKSIDQILMEHFDIDGKKCDEERRAVLKYVRRES